MLEPTYLSQKQTVCTPMINAFLTSLVLTFSEAVPDPKRAAGLSLGMLVQYESTKIELLL